MYMDGTLQRYSNCTQNHYTIHNTSVHKPPLPWVSACHLVTFSNLIPDPKNVYSTQLDENFNTLHFFFWFIITGLFWTFGLLFGLLCCKFQHNRIFFHYEKHFGGCWGFVLYRSQPEIKKEVRLLFNFPET